MEEVSAILLGMKTNVIRRTHKDVKNGALYGILSVLKVIIMLHAVYAHLIVKMAKLILESHAKRRVMEELLVFH